MTTIENIMTLADHYAMTFGDSRNDAPNRQALQTAIEDALAATCVKITDDQATTHQFRVIEQRGKWQLLADIAHHEFRIRKLAHDIVLYTGIPLAEAKKRFNEKVENDNE
jgi:hypothetical protein